ncbi:MAG: hypothetical protein HOM14_20790 [Gammaproteobacteria bacterium]|jgi:hypothetical protein|nr:hypothetical protein [Gammaproteobacteria bacterium]MBT3723885.1 hypothetical protein [Gammaproteobacteria bacterium]MBT4194501.1 hypothetical protein [Gammaproteobacteria bacterium]MBT4449738.1 hypothetical protein [Gammaproteobacteria bacterium]MBT4862665.1 hypothetical protein [Gammaproteobacteria bacterium]
MMQIVRSFFKPAMLALILLINGLVFSSAWANSIRIFTLSADQWARPRAGEVIPQFEPVKLAMAYWESGTDASILLSHAGEDSGEIWASELKDWLISLGVPSDFILISSGLQGSDEMRILVGSRQELMN